jgi:toxin-antitoxin system PIN domain toxin
MIAVDTNILVYSHRRESSEHVRAAALLTQLAGEATPWCIPWPCIYEFFSTVTNARIWKDRASMPHQAHQQIAAWLASPSLHVIAETDGFLATLAPLIGRSRVRGPIVHDARIAALCLAHGVTELLTRDRDFSLFPELKYRDPFAE